MSNRVRRTPQRPSRGRVQQRAESSRRGLIAAVGAGLVVAAVVIIAIVATTGSDNGEEPGVAFNGVSLAPFAAGADDTAVGQKAPLFVTEDVNGSRVVTGGGGGPNDTAKVIAFVAHWCPTCQAEVPRLADWLETHDLPDGVEVLVVSTFEDAGRDNYPATAWFSAEGLPMPALLDSADSQIAAAYGFGSVPSWAVLDNQNFVLARTTGGLTSDGFASLVSLAATGL